MNDFDLDEVVAQAAYDEARANLARLAYELATDVLENVETPRRRVLAEAVIEANRVVDRLRRNLTVLVAG